MEGRFTAGWDSGDCGNAYILMKNPRTRDSVQPGAACGLQCVELIAVNVILRHKGQPMGDAFRRVLPVVGNE